MVVAEPPVKRLAYDPLFFAFKPHQLPEVEDVFNASSCCFKSRNVAATSSPLRINGLSVVMFPCAASM